MSGRHYRSRRSVRSEILPIAVVLAIPLVLVWIFPYAALSPLAKQETSGTGQARPFCAIVELNAEEEAMALAAARTAWHVNSEGVKRLRIEMFADDLPDDASGPVVEIDQRTRTRGGRVIPYKPVFLPSDFRAPEPVVLAKPEAPAKPQPFPKEEMLKLYLPN